MTDLLFFGTIFILCIILILIVHKMDQIRYTVDILDGFQKLHHETLRKISELQKSHIEDVKEKHRGLDERITYLHRVFFTNRQTVSTKIELLESEIHVINTVLGYAPGQMQYESKEDADRRDANEGLEQGK